jgi:hypothetical protein
VHIKMDSILIPTEIERSKYKEMALRATRNDGPGALGTRDADSKPVPESMLRLMEPS